MILKFSTFDAPWFFLNSISRNNFDWTKYCTTVFTRLKQYYTIMKWTF